MGRVLANTWTPEQWVAVVATMIGAVASAVVSIIGAYKTMNLHNEVRPPSNGVTNGQLTENTAYSLHLLADAIAGPGGKKVELPSPRDPTPRLGPETAPPAPAP